MNPPKRSAAHLRWIRSLPCTITACNGAAQAAHVRQRSGGGTALKPPDWFTVPLCHYHHTEQGTLNHVRFDARHRVDLRAYALILAARSPVYGASFAAPRGCPSCRPNQAIVAPEPGLR